ncbi:MAG: alpha/beta hydrolase family protein [Nitrospiria bacterium]
MIRLIGTLILFSSIASISGCIEYPHYSDALHDKHETQLSFDLESGPSPRVLTRTLALMEEDYLIETVQFESFSLRFWRPKDSRFRPAILLLPGIWGDRIIAQFAQDLVSKGFACAQLYSHRYLDRLRGASKINLDALAAMIRHQVIETGQVYRWLSTQPEIDSDRVGILGVSIGAIIATLFSESEGKIQAAGYLLGGGNLPDIMTAPKGYVKKRLRDRIITENGFSEDEFKEAAIRSLRSVDPLTYAGNLDPKRILMVNGRFDRVIPYINAKQLWKALGEPNWLVLPAGHYTASLFMPYVRQRVARHFIERLAAS